MQEESSPVRVPDSEQSSSAPRRYYRLNTGGRRENSTNLQLYMLRQGMDFWTDTLACEQLYGVLQLPDRAERFVATIIMWGASVSQLLGQNSPPATRPRIDGPRELWTAFVAKHRPVIQDPNGIVLFFTAYDRCRHFGLSEGDWSHDAISRIDLTVMRSHFSAVREIWYLVACEVAGPEDASALVDEEFDSLD